MLACLFQFFYQLFIFMLVFIDNLVCQFECVAIQFINKIYLDYSLPYRFFLSVDSEIMSGIRIKFSFVSLSDHLTYLIVGPYYFNIKFQKSALSVVKFSSVIFLWSLYTVIQCTSTMVHNYFRVSTIINSYIYLVVYLI